MSSDFKKQAPAQQPVEEFTFNKKSIPWQAATDAEEKLCELVEVNKAILEAITPTDDGEPVDPSEEQVLQVLQETRDCILQLKATRLIPLGNVCYS